MADAKTAEEKKGQELLANEAKQQTRLLEKVNTTLQGLQKSQTKMFDKDEYIKQAAPEIFGEWQVGRKMATRREEFDVKHDITLVDDKIVDMHKDQISMQSDEQRERAGMRSAEAEDERNKRTKWQKLTGAITSGFKGIKKSGDKILGGKLPGLGTLLMMGVGGAILALMHSPTMVKLKDFIYDKVIPIFEPFVEDLVTFFGNPVWPEFVILFDKNTKMMLAIAALLALKVFGVKGLLAAVTTVSGLLTGAFVGDLAKSGAYKAAIAQLGGLGKIIPITAILLAISVGISEAINAVDLAEEWKVSKTKAAIGGFLGGTKSGWKNAFLKGSTWGAAGAGAGFMVGGPLGALIGGIGGAALGALAGYFGGEKIAKALDWVDKKVSGAWKTAVGAGTIKNIKDSIVGFWTSTTRELDKAIETASKSGTIKNLKDSVLGFFSDVVGIINAVFDIDWKEFMRKAFGKNVATEALISLIFGKEKKAAGWDETRGGGLIGPMEKEYAAKIAELQMVSGAATGGPTEAQEKKIDKLTREIAVLKKQMKTGLTETQLRFRNEQWTEARRGGPRIIPESIANAVIIYGGAGSNDLGNGAATARKMVPQYNFGREPQLPLNILQSNAAVTTTNSLAVYPIWTTDEFAVLRDIW